MKRSVFAVFAALLIAGSAAIGAVGAATISSGAPNPVIVEDTFTKQSHKMSWDNATVYEGDNGNLKTPYATVNQSVDNPFTLTATNFEVDDFDEFPRKSAETNNTASALDASEWTVASVPTGATADVVEATTAPSTPAVEFSMTNVTSGDTVVYKYSNVSITSDAEKRYLSIAADVLKVNSGASAQLRINDADGDYVAIDLVNTSTLETAEAVLANATGEGNVEQVQTGALTVTGTGDGTLAEIQSLEIRVSGNEVSMRFPLINLDAMSAYKFGERMEDTDSDDALETVTVNEPTGPYSVSSLDSFGDAFDTATLYSLKMPLKWQASNLPDADTKVNATQTNKYPGYDYVVDYWYRMQVPTAYDLTHAGLELRQEQKRPSDRYLAVEYKEGVSDTKFSELDTDSFTSVTSAFVSEGSMVTIDSTIQPGQQIAIHEVQRYTESGWESVQSAGAIMPQEGGGGISATFGAIIGGIVGAIGLVLNRLRGLAG